MPRTEAGKRLVNSQVWVGVARDLAVEVERIEAEAVAAERARIRREVERSGNLHPWDHRFLARFDRDTVLAIVNREDIRED